MQKLIPLASLLVILAPGWVLAANHSWGASTDTFDCAAQGVNGGDTITLAAGAHRVSMRKTLQNCDFGSSSPVTVRNSTAGKTIIERTGGGAGDFVFRCHNCLNVVIDGTGPWTGKPPGSYCGVDESGKAGCGIKITSTSGSPAAFLKFTGTSSQFTVRGVEVDGNYPSITNNGTAISCHDSTTGTSASGWRENILLEQNYLHNVHNAAYYCGPNWTSNDGDVLRLRNVTIQDNYAHDLGSNAFSIKSTIEGKNIIRRNRIYRSGLAQIRESFSDCILVYEGYADVYDNFLVDCGGNGIGVIHTNISLTQTFPVAIYNNVIIRTGQIYPTRGKGILISSPSSATLQPTIQNNTIKASAQEGIRVSSNTASGVARNNIMVDCGGSCLSGSGTAMNNITGASSSVGFVDNAADNLRLAAGSPAIDAVSVGYPLTDFDGNSRPQGKAGDIGAFEFTGSIAKPQPPIVIVTQ
jgi:hypothetical protein